ncbi:hypothetical protein ACHAXN_013335 [Cyclotella atomus]
MKYLEDTRLTQLSSDLTEAFLNTRGSGSHSASSMRNNIRGTRRNSVRGGKGKRHANGNSTPAKAGSSSPYLPSSTFHYNPAGYTSYDGGTSSSSRVIYGKIEAYTTKRAGSDKKTAHEVGERYAHEMERLNEAVEEMKKKHLLEHAGKDGEANAGDDTVVLDAKRKLKSTQEGEKQAKRRDRSRSLDGVTFGGSSAMRMSPIPEQISSTEPTEEQLGKRSLPLEGILKPPSNNKRWRATSFDIATGPSSFELEGRRGRLISTGNHDEIDDNVHPLMPQPSLYQSSIPDISGKASSMLPSMAPRRLVTDLILTLNASFPDYDFSDARTSDFCKLSVTEAMRRINENMSEFASTTDKGQNYLPRFWETLDDLLFGLKDAEVYSYAPQSGGGDDDPLGFLTQTLAGGTDSTPSGGCLLFPTEDTLLDGLDAATSLDLPHRILTSPVTRSEDTAQVTLWAMNYFFVSRNKKRIILFACVQTMRSPQGGEDYEGDEYQYGENDLVFDEARRSKTEEEKETEYTSFSLADTISRGDDSNMADDGEYGVDVDVDEDEDVGDEDQEETEFDTGALNCSVHPPSDHHTKY